MAFVEVQGKGLCCVTGGADGKVVLRDADSNTVLATHTEAEPIESLSVDSKARCIAIGVDIRTQVGRRGMGSEGMEW